MQQSGPVMQPKLQHTESSDQRPVATDKARIVEQIRAQLRFVLPASLMQQLQRNNPRFFAN